MVLKTLKKCLEIFMKISIGTKIKDGPWGGGNLFAINLIHYLRSKNHTVVNNLDDEDIDLILLTEPRKTSESSAFTHIDVRNYLDYVKKNTLVIHRINECDERKGTNYVNKYLISANKYADHTIFVSSWLKNLYSSQGMKNENSTIIYAGADSSIFNNDDHTPWNQQDKLKIVTHHWGANWNKGFDVYQKLDEMLENKKWKNKIDFTYIGNLPKNFKFNNTKHIPPLSGNTLANEIKKSHIYLTGSINEPSGNHHIEGAQCGLPVMYIDSGGTTEYCKDYGVEYDLNNFEIKLDTVINDYQILYDKVLNYPFSANLMSENYLKLFEKLFSNKDEIIFRRTNKIPEGNLYKFYYKFSRKIKKRKTKKA